MRAITFVFTLLVAACASVPSVDTESVTESMSRFMEALNALDADAIEARLASDVTAFFPVTKRERVDGKEGVAAVFRTYCEETKKTTSRTAIVPQELTVSRSGDLAIVTFQVSHPAVVSRRTFVFRREGATWLITHMHASNHRLEPK